MVTLTAPDGTGVNIDAAEVIRARRTVSGERGGDNGNARTRIDWAITQLVPEPIEEVAPAIKAALPSFTCLTTTDGSKIWFDALKVSGPLPITAGQKQNSVRSSIKIMGYRQFVTETPQEVRTVIQEAGSTPVT